LVGQTQDFDIACQQRGPAAPSESFSSQHRAKQTKQDGFAGEVPLPHSLNKLKPDPARGSTGPRRAVSRMDRMNKFLQEKA
jgi:hypothetical protein